MNPGTVLCSEGSWHICPGLSLQAIYRPCAGRLFVHDVVIHLLWVKLCSPKEVYWRPHPQKSQNVTFFGNRVFLGTTKLNEIIRVALTPIWLVSVKEWETGTRTHIHKECHAKIKAEIGVVHLQAKKNQTRQQTVSLWGEAQNGPFFITWEGTNTVDTLILDFWSPYCETMSFWCWSQPVYGTSYDSSNT